MKKLIVAFSLALACGVFAYAQKTETQASGEVGNQSSAAVTRKNINLESGTRLAAELQNAIDVRNVKVGDQVLLKTTQAIKSGGRTVVGKGARLVGHITEVARQGKGHGESRVGILFDQIEEGSLAVPISATIVSVTTGRASARANTDGAFDTDIGASGSGRLTGSARTSSSNNGGLLGGVGGVVNSTTSTAGAVVGNATSAAGTTIDSTTSVAGNAGGGVGSSLRGVRISQSSNASVESSSMLSLQGDNLRLEKGTRFSLVLIQATSAGTAKDQ
jgi:hypothetical protein